ncbi:MAG: hypothetical protein C0516_15745 [Gemmatimonas sp.]|nr:hypothetical protein [Gemmatimonas sp.]
MSVQRGNDLIRIVCEELRQAVPALTGGFPNRQARDALRAIPRKSCRSRTNQEDLEVSDMSDMLKSIGASQPYPSRDLVISNQCFAAIPVHASFIQRGYL